MSPGILAVAIVVPVVVVLIVVAVVIVVIVKKKKTDADKAGPETISMTKTRPKSPPNKEAITKPNDEPKVQNMTDEEDVNQAGTEGGDLTKKGTATEKADVNI